MSESSDRVDRAGGEHALRLASKAPLALGSVPVVRITIAIRSDVWRAMSRLAAKQEISKNAWLRRAIRERVEQEEADALREL